MNLPLSNLLLTEELIVRKALVCPLFRYPYWTLIRSTLYRSLKNSTFHPEYQSFTLTNRSFSLSLDPLAHSLNLLSFLSISLLRRVFAQQPKHILTFSTNTLNYPDNNQICNKLLSPYSRMLANYPTIHFQFLSYPTKSLVNDIPQTHSLSLLSFIATILSIPLLPLSYFISLIEIFRIRRIINHTTVRELAHQSSLYYLFLSFKLSLKICQYPFQSLFIYLLCFIFRPSAFICEEGSYPYMSPYIRSFKRLSVPTLEFQHGIIDNLHEAYNYSDSFLESSLHNSALPTCILTFGRFWHQFIHSSSDLIPLGYLYRESEIRRMLRSTDQSSLVPIVTIFGNGIDLQGALSLYLALQSNHDLSRYIFYLRPHPCELQQLSNYLKKTKSCLLIDETLSPYEAFSRSEFIITTHSTCIFEASGFPCKVLVYPANQRDYIYPDNVLSFNDLESLVDYLRHQKASLPTLRAITKTSDSDDVFMPASAAILFQILSNLR